MIKYLQESTNVVKSRKRLSKLILIVAYLLIWAWLMILFWCFLDTGDEMGYGLLAFYIVLPVTTVIISFFIGKDDSWANWKWVMMLFFGIMYMMAGYATFSLANMISFGKINEPDLATLIPGIICAAVGLAAGSIVNRISNRRKARKTS